uniref:Putative secreted protein n=2 Tax=Haematobia irritans TaxID=7368 RepID=A0A1L8EHZ3_HAEIR
MLPSLSTKISSACIIVDSLWAIIIVVRLEQTLCKAACMFLSVLVSSADVASSSNTKTGAFKSVLAMATRCFSPPLKRKPRSPTFVS